ncbi:MAG: D-cysteine desulfhydrase family protein [Candidatus Latescibacteria bacterium]|nr:D-cysteine desulfhydrase family protein [Candidatus Latescibacterota bacterium]
MITPLKLASKPTPIEFYTGVFPDFDFHIKRDDLTGLEGSGNKIRKLEYLLADAENNGSDLIITCGGIQSNHCRATMYCCAKLGWQGVCVVKGEKPKIAEGNLLLDFLFNAQVEFLPTAQYLHKEDYIAEMIDDFKKKGHKPYFIPTGGSNGIGALGYIFAMDEMAAYIDRHKIDAVFCAVGSGGTYAGLLMGKYQSSLAVPVYGVLVDETPAFFEAKIKSIIGETEKVLERKFPIRDTDIKLIDGYIGPGYGVPYDEEIAIIRQMARKGLILDPVYTGKTFFGMVDKKSELGFSNPLFIHTGGIFSVFAYPELKTQADFLK